MTSPVCLERPGHGSIFPLDAGIRESEDIRIGIVEDAVGGPGVQPSSQFHAAIAKREPYGDQNSGRCFFVVKLGVEFE